MTCKSSGKPVVSSVGGLEKGLIINFQFYALVGIVVRNFSYPLFPVTSYEGELFLRCVKGMHSLPHFCVTSQHCIYSCLVNEQKTLLLFLSLKFCFVTGGKVHLLYFHC